MPRRSRPRGRSAKAGDSGLGTRGEARRADAAGGASGANRGKGEELLRLLLEVNGASRRDKAARVATARTLSVPAVNNHGGFGRWAFVEIMDIYDATAPLRAAIAVA